MQINTVKRVDKIEGCCESFNDHINRKCTYHGFDCPDNVIRLYISYNGKNANFGIPHPDKISFYIINFCPWCGKNIKKIANNSMNT